MEYELFVFLIPPPQHQLSRLAIKLHCFYCCTRVLERLRFFSKKREYKCNLTNKYKRIVVVVLYCICFVFTLCLSHICSLSQFLTVVVVQKQKKKNKFVACWQHQQQKHQHIIWRKRAKNERDWVIVCLLLQYECSLVCLWAYGWLLCVQKTSAFSGFCQGLLKIKWKALKNSWIINQADWPL